MAEKKQRQVVNDLGNLPQLSPQSDPRALDIYYRPGAPEIQAPSKTNPTLKLAEALGALEPVGQAMFAQGMQGLHKIDEAKGAEEATAERLNNREAWNQKIKEGLPPGVSPWYARGYHRASLEQLVQDHYAETHAGFYGEAGAEARKSNDPRVMQKFLDDSEKALREKLKGGKFSPLDFQEVLDPHLRNNNQAMMKTHAAFRVAEQEKEFEALASSNIQSRATAEIAKIVPGMDDREIKAHLETAAFAVNDVLYNEDNGIVKNGMIASKGNDLLIDTLTALMMKEENPRYGELLQHIKTKDGAPIGNTKNGLAKVLAAEEHITALQMRRETHQHWKEVTLPHEKHQHARQVQLEERQDKEWEHTLQQWSLQKENISDDEKVKGFTRRIYQALRSSDSKGAQKRLDDIFLQVEEQLPHKAEHLHSLVHTTMQRNVDYQDNPVTVARLRLEISKNPLAFDENRLAALVKAKEIKPGTMMQLFDDLDRRRQHGDHEFMQQSDFIHTLGKVEAMATYDESGVEGKTPESMERGLAAVDEFRDKATEWIEKNPQGSIASFRNYMRDQVDVIVKRHNPEFKESSQKKADKAGAEQKAKGQGIVNEFQAAAAKAQEKKLKQDTLKAKQEREEKILDDFNKSFKPSGIKSKETGREFLTNEKGEVATQKLITVNGIPGIAGGGIVNIPTIIGGKLYSDREAIDIIERNGGKDPDTGKPLKRYYSISDAEVAAREQSKRLGKEWESLQKSKKDEKSSKDKDKK